VTSITALLHTKDDALRLGRCLETLYPCDEIVVVDHGSQDATVRTALDYGARVVTAQGALLPQHYVQSALRTSGPGWILALDPRESLTESLAASLFEWKTEVQEVNEARPCSVFLREETAEGWIDHPAAQTRLVPSGWKLWSGKLPMHDPAALALEGELLRFVFP